MLFTKITTCLLGLALLVPISASFWLMLSYRAPSEAELRKSLEETLAPVKADIDARVEPGFPGAMAASIEIRHELTLPIFGERLWLFAPRAWVGAVGLICCFIIAGLWVYSTFVSSIAISGEYGRTGMDEVQSQDGIRGEMTIGDSPESDSRIIRQDSQK